MSPVCGIFFLQNCSIHEDNALEYTDKNYAAKAGEVRQMLTGLAKGGGAVGGNADTG